MKIIKMVQMASLSFIFLLLSSILINRLSDHSGLFFEKNNIISSHPSFRGQTNLTEYLIGCFSTIGIDVYSPFAQHLIFITIVSIFLMMLQTVLLRENAGRKYIRTFLFPVWFSSGILFFLRF